MRLKKSGLRGKGPLAVIASGLGVYVAATVAFDWFIAPTVAKNQAAVDAYNPPLATIAQYSDAPFASPVWSSRPSASKPSTSAAIAATLSAPTEGAADTAPKKTTKKSAPRAARHGPFASPVRSELPSRVASKRPTSATAAVSASAKKTADTVAKKTTKKKSARRPLGTSDRRETSGTGSILPGAASNGSRQRSWNPALNFN